MTYPSLYSIVQFKPYRETDEFVNVGVVLCCPSAGFFGHLINKSGFARINHFFSHLEKSLAKKAIHYIDAELSRVKGLSGSLNGDALRHLFLEATKHREGIILFGAPRPILLKNDLDTELKRLYNHHIGHSFAKNSSPQERLEKQMQNTLVKYSLDRHYKPKVLSDGLVETRIPFVSQSKQGVLAAIKPLNLDQRSAGLIIEEGDKWAGRLRRLVSKGAIEASRILLPLAMPESDTRSRAAQLVITELKREKLATTDATNKEDIIAFATSNAI